MLAVCLTAIRQLLSPERVWFSMKRKDPIVGNFKKPWQKAQSWLGFFFFSLQFLKTLQKQDIMKTFSGKELIAPLFQYKNYDVVLL